MIPDGKTIILGSIARQGKTDKELVIILTPHIIPPEGGRKPGP
jgi:Flp pilus assembly secretin CpaC